jgi:hypothetical protein
MLQTNVLLWMVLGVEVVDGEPWRSTRGSRRTSTAEYVRRHNAGVARRNSGILDTVQYLNGPTFLEINKELAD